MMTLNFTIHATLNNTNHTLEKKKSIINNGCRSHVLNRFEWVIKTHGFWETVHDLQFALHSVAY